jgi:hypothetical protein
MSFKLTSLSLHVRDFCTMAVTLLVFIFIALRFWRSCLGFLGVLLLKTFSVIWLSNLSILALSDECYSWNYIVTIILLYHSKRERRIKLFVVLFSSMPKITQLSKCNRNRFHEIPYFREAIAQLLVCYFELNTPV